MAFVKISSYTEKAIIILDIINGVSNAMLRSVWIEIE